MNPQPDLPIVRVGSTAGLLSVIPRLLGFTLDTSLVIVGTTPPSGRVQLVFRYDLPQPPDPGLAADIAGHAVSVLASHHVATVTVAGYGPGPLVTPVADAIRDAAAYNGLDLRDVLRVHDGRYWSYLRPDPSCCPAEGVPFDPAAHPAAAAMAAAGLPALADRAELAATIAPLTGPPAEEMLAATRRIERAATRLITRDGERGLDKPGLAAVRQAIGVYRDGGSLDSPEVHAWLALVLIRLPVRDDAWARMDPAHREAHRRLWTDVVRRAQPGYLAAPATLLAFTAWQCGDGALANIALDRALADTPGYSMALLIQRALDAGTPPSVAFLPMTPEDVAASYADPGEGDADHPGAPPAGD